MSIFASTNEVEKMNTVTLECPQCRRKLEDVPLDPSDPPGTAVVVAHCERCDGEDNGLVDYFDADGKQIFLA